MVEEMRNQQPERPSPGFAVGNAGVGEGFGEAFGQKCPGPVENPPVHGLAFPPQLVEVGMKFLA